MLRQRGDAAKAADRTEIDASRVNDTPIAGASALRYGTGRTAPSNCWSTSEGSALRRLPHGNQKVSGGQRLNPINRCTVTTNARVRDIVGYFLTARAYRR